MCTRCNKLSFRKHLCYEHWKESRSSRYHCTWSSCTSPLFALTLCRTHYRAANVDCNVDSCRRPVYCKQVCSYHYRKGIIPPLRICDMCEQSVYMNRKCFTHFIHRTCIQCGNPAFAKQLCQAHYMHKRRFTQELRNTGPTTKKENTPVTIHMRPDTTNHNPEIQSSG